MTDNPEVSDLQMQIMQARYWKNTWRENLIRPRWADCPTTGWPSGWGSARRKSLRPDRA